MKTLNGKSLLSSLCQREVPEAIPKAFGTLWQPEAGALSKRGEGRFFNVSAYFMNLLVIMVITW
ncbi:MAG: hypothetical protein ACYC69_13210 [Thermodesulfovibrionales bacterium]